MGLDYNTREWRNKKAKEKLAKSRAGIPIEEPEPSALRSTAAIAAYIVGGFILAITTIFYFLIF